MRRGIRGALARAAGWAMLASLSSLALALFVGVGGFRALGTPTPRPSVQVTRAASAAHAIPSPRVGVDEAENVARIATARAASASNLSDGLAESLAAHARIARVQAAAMAPTATPTSAAPTSASLAIEAQPTGSTGSAARPDGAAAAATPAPAVEVRAQQLSVATPDLKPGDRVTVPVTFYYCKDGPANYPAGDGGGFCGVMRDGTRVYPGAAACAYHYLGQLFKIIGDPTGRIYKCADTGSAIHGLHRDIWFENSDDGWVWQHQMGRTAVIEILP